VAVKPALTPEEWEWGYDSRDLSVRLRNGGRVDVTATAHPLGGALGEERDLHALAALALHGQEYGFTHEDLGVLDVLAQLGAMYPQAPDERVIIGKMGNGPGIVPYVEVTVGVLRACGKLSDRIAALLPPREP
jgi:hypothetical protein